MEEATVVIKGQTLTTAQVATLRVSLNSFTMSLRQDGLGEDDHGKKMTVLYLENCKSILRLLHSHQT